MVEDITGANQTYDALRDSDNKFATIIDFLSDATFVIDLEGKVVAWNRAMEEMSSVSKGDMIGQGDHAYTVPFYGERRPQLLDLLDKDDKEITSKYQYVQRKGDTLYAETFAPALFGGKGAYVWATASKLYDSNGTQIGAIESIRDITVQKKAEDRLAKLNKCFLDFSTDAEQNINRLVALCGEQLGATCALYNRLQDGKLCSVGQWNTPPDFVSEDIPDGHICYDLIRSCEREVKVICDLPHTIYSETDSNVLRYNLKTYLGCTVFYVGTCVGSLCAVYQDDHVPSEEDRRFTEILAMAIGIEEERKRANEALQKSERSYRLLAENVTDVIWSMDMNMKFVYISPSNALMTGFSNDEAMALKLEDILTPSSFGVVKQILADEFETEKMPQKDLSRSRTIEVEEYCKDGRTIWVEIRATFLRDQEGQPIGIQGVSRNITDRKQIQEALKRSEKEKTAILGGLKNGAVEYLDPQMRIIWVNEAVQKSLGLSIKEIQGKYCFELIEGLDAPCPGCTAVIACKTGEPQEGELVTPDGKTWISCSNPLKDSRGQVTGVVHVAINITGRKRAEDALKESEDKYRAIFENTGTSTVILEEDTTISLANEEFEKLTGYTKDEIEGKKTWTDFVMKDDLEKMMNQHRLRRENPGTALKTYEFRLRDRSGLIKNILLTVDVISGTRKSVASLLDISELKRAEEELRWNSALLEAQVESSLDGILVVDGQGKRIITNQRLLDLWNVPKSIIDQDKDEALLEYVVGRIKNPSQFLEKVTYLYHHPDETSRDEIEFKDGLVMDRYSSPVSGRDGRYYGRIWTFRDITDRKRDVEELRKAHDELEMREKERTVELEVRNAEMERFIYTVSHELRSPLISASGIVGFLRQDLEQGDAKRTETDLKLMERAMTKMDQLLGEILDLSRIGRVANPPADVPFGEIVTEALDQEAEKLRLKDVEVSVASDLPKVHVDRTRIVEVLVNLIENSIRYIGDQPQPRIEIGHRLDGDQVVFIVQDNGIGIDPSQHEKVFGLFYRVDGKGGGTGVGLTLVNRIIEVHGGRIWIESELRKGCTVCFTLPLT